jgi:hypothetical protein
MKQWALCFTSIFYNGDQPNQIVKHNITHVTRTFWKNGGDCDIEIGDFLKLGGFGDGVLLGSLCFVFQEFSLTPVMKKTLEKWSIIIFLLWKWMPSFSTTS